METALALLMFPVMLLNFAGGVVAAIWLVISGQWYLAVELFLVSLIWTWILGFILSPTLLIAAPLQWCIEKKKYFFARILAAISTLWTYIVMTVWCTGSFIWVLNQHSGGLLFPYLLAAYATATGPWVYMASQEVRSGGGDASATMSFVVCVGSILMMILAFSGFSQGVIIMSFAGIMLAAWIFHFIFLRSLIKNPA